MAAEVWGAERAVRERALRQHLGRSPSAAARALSLSGPLGALPQPSAVNGGGMEREGSGGSGASAGLLQQILSLKLVPRVGNGTLCPNSTSLCSFPGTGRPAGPLRGWFPGGEGSALRRPGAGGGSPSASPRRFAAGPSGGPPRSPGGPRR